MTGQLAMGGLGAAPDDEKAYEKLIVRTGRDYQWTVNKTRKTPIKRDGRTFWITSTTVKGWPDLTLIHPAGYVLVLEVKGTGGSMSAEQRNLMRDVLQPAMRLVPDHRFEAYVAWPADWPGVHQALARPLR